MKKLKIDFEDLLLAYEGFSGGEVEHYLDTETGEIVMLHPDMEDAEELREQIDSGFGEQYLAVGKLESRESFQIMEEFVAALPASRRRSELVEAISRNKPFRRFKDIVHSDLALRDEWFAFRDDALASHARDWLKAHGIEAEPPRAPK